MLRKTNERKCMENRSIATRTKDAKAVYIRTKSHKQAVRTYCTGNKWLTENAKAVGNW